MRTKLFLFSLILLCFAIPTQAADINAASCSQADVQAAVDSAIDGDRVLVPAGSCTWTTQVSVTDKGITLEGAGIGVTTITNSTSSNILFFALEDGDSMTEVLNFTFDGNDIDTLGSNFIEFRGGGLDGFRFHHSEFINLVGTGLTVNQDGLETSGLVDNVVFNMPTTSGSKSIRIVGTGSQEHQPFSRPFALGGPIFIFIEDCTFNFDGGNDGAYDAFTGARYVFRYNEVNNTFASHHGADSGNQRGVHSFEIYNNDFDRTEAGNRRMHYLRSASGVIYNNTYAGNYSPIAIVLTIFRSDEVHPPWGQCDGTSIWDANEGPPGGWPCLDQSGYIFTEVSGGDYTFQGIYEWNNLYEGSTNVDFTTDGHDSGAYFTSGVEYFNDTVRPGYTPFPYPHPLRNGSPRPDPATNLRTIVR